MSDRIVIISYGKIIANGTPSELILELSEKTTLIVEEGGVECLFCSQDRVSECKSREWRCFGANQ